ncbi:MAG: aspartate carbamoyltransferase [Candidatus Freyarchaeota archaeon]|nr:aspartate carbamoyltransferase [Candidatus Freyrarchaeum guaymaensis]
MPGGILGLKDVVSIKDFSRRHIEWLHERAEEMEEVFRTGSDILKGKILATLFMEPSTRTKLSFATAMYKLGGNVIGFESVETSSIAKGENLNDTIKTVENYCDAVVLRHWLEGAAKFASEIANVPVINAGSGTEEHPTQALLDLFTIKREIGRIDGLKVALMGDLKYGRTVKSLSYGLANFDVEIYLVSPESLRMSEEVIRYLEKRGVTVEEHRNLEKIIKKIDVLYVTRIQRERFPDPTEYERLRGSYKIDLKTLEEAKPNMILMHPLPRVDEIAPEVDATPYAKYFKQPYYGVIVRMAILKALLS